MIKMLKPAARGVAHTLLAAAIPLLALCASPADAAPEIEPKVLARINGEALTDRDARRILANPVTMRQLQRDAGLAAMDAQTAYRQAVHVLIEQKLLLQEAKRRNLTVSEQDLDQAVTELRRRFGDLKQFGAWMKVNAIDDRALFDVLRDDILVKRAADALIKEVRVDDQEVRAYYDSHPDDFRGPGQFRLQIIAVQREELAKQVLIVVNTGVDFSQLARTHSQGARAASGGDTGWVSWKEIPAPLREVVRTLKIGQTGGPVSMGKEFRVVRLSGHRPGPLKPLADVRSEARRLALEDKRKQTYGQWQADAEKKAKVEWLI